VQGDCICKFKICREIVFVKLKFAGWGIFVSLKFAEGLYL
jgi:hypothetical protein